MTSYPFLPSWELNGYNRVSVTELLVFPVFAISPGGVDVYPSETELVTCHRRAVKQTYRNLTLIDSDRDRVRVEKYRVHPLPPRPTAEGRLSADNVRVELLFGPTERLSFSEVRAAVLEGLRETAGEEFDEADERVTQVTASKNLKELTDALLSASV